MNLYSRQYYDEARASLNHASHLPAYLFFCMFSRKRGSLQVSVYQMHAFIVIDLHGVTCLCSYRRLVTAGN